MEKVIAPGRKFLFVTGILYIVLAGIAVITAVGGLITSGWWDDALPAANGMPWVAYYGVLLLIALYGVFMGIMGVVSSNKPERGGLCKILAMVAVVGVVVGIVLAIQTLGAIGGAAAAFGALGDAALITLYFIGAHKNQRAAEEVGGTMEGS